jgi:hypothetical protein
LKILGIEGETLKGRGYDPGCDEAMVDLPLTWIPVLPIRTKPSSRLSWKTVLWQSSRRSCRKMGCAGLEIGETVFHEKDGALSYR